MSWLVLFKSADGVLKRLPAMADRLQARASEEQAKVDRLQAVADEVQGEADRVQAIADEEQAVTDEAQAKADRLQAVADEVQAQTDRHTEGIAKRQVLIRRLSLERAAPQGRFIRKE